MKLLVLVHSLLLVVILAVTLKQFHTTTAQSADAHAAHEEPVGWLIPFSPVFFTKMPLK